MSILRHTVVVVVVLLYHDFSVRMPPKTTTTIIMARTGKGIRSNDGVNYETGDFIRYFA